MIQHFISQESLPIVTFLNQQLAESETEGLELLNFGAVYLNKKRQLQPVQIQVGDYLRVHTQPRRFPVQDIDWRQTIVFANEDFLVLNKPSGFPTHATVANLYENVLEQMKKALQIELYVTNRLDVATNGLLLLAKNKKFQTAFNNALRDNQVSKFYQVTLENRFEQTTSPQSLIHYMKNDFTQPKVLSDWMQEGYLKCHLQIHHSQVVETAQFGILTQAKIQLLTGRTHQIRSQFAFIGHPVRGDKLYGSKFPWQEKEAIDLTSCYLSFVLGEKFEFSLEPPTVASKPTDKLKNTRGCHHS